MTQKELLYFEDAVGHETAILEICNDIKENLEDEDLVSFFEDEIELHESMKEDLLNLMEEKANE